MGRKIKASDLWMITVVRLQCPICFGELLFAVQPPETSKWIGREEFQPIRPPHLELDAAECRLCLATWELRYYIGGEYNLARRSSTRTSEDIESLIDRAAFDCMEMNRDPRSIIREVIDEVVARREAEKARAASRV
jgi:hypothetical protein